MVNKSYENSRLLILIVISQFACTSLWFAGNAVMTDIVSEYGLKGNALGYMTSAVQFGFITGTLLFSIFTISDRFSPSKVFFISAVIGALANLIIFITDTTAGLLLSRYITGLCLAGIYPVGMKIAADYHEKGLGKALGYLVGALVLGTAFPHLLKATGASWPWRYIMVSTSAMALIGGTLILLFVPDGPHRVKAGKPDFSLFLKLFRNKNFRAVVFGYFGHMWELYAYWAFVPVILATYGSLHPGQNINISLASFLLIGTGFISCIIGGYVSLRYGNAKVAATALSLSLLCCLLSPVFFKLSFGIFIVMLAIWCIAVIADSPQFTSMIAQSVAPAEKGTALTIANTIGFFITIVSIQLLSSLSLYIPAEYLFLLLAPGPLSGLLAFRRMLHKKVS